MSIFNKYKPHIEKLMQEESVSEFATLVYNNFQTMSKEEFDDGVYLEHDENDTPEVKQHKTAINHIKKRLCL